jgi:F-type H+-transporting ATPase subunit epsilon
MNEFSLEVLTPSKKVYDGSVLSVTLPGTLGGFQVLFNHAPLISTLEVGKMKIRTTSNDEEIYSVSNGVAEVLKNKVLVLVKSIEKLEEIDVERAEKSAERARARLEDKSNPSIDVARAEAALQRALNRIKIKTSI